MMAPIFLVLWAVALVKGIRFSRSKKLMDQELDWDTHRKEVQSIIIEEDAVPRDSTPMDRRRRSVPQILADIAEEDALIALGEKVEQRRRASMGQDENGTPAALVRPPLLRAQTIGAPLWAKEAAAAEVAGSGSMGGPADDCGQMEARCTASAPPLRSEQASSSLPRLGVDAVEPMPATGSERGNDPRRRPGSPMDSGHGQRAGQSDGAPFQWWPFAGTPADSFTRTPAAAAPSITDPQQAGTRSGRTISHTIPALYVREPLSI